MAPELSEVPDGDLSAFEFAGSARLAPIGCKRLPAASKRTKSSKPHRTDPIFSHRNRRHCHDCNKKSPHPSGAPWHPLATIPVCPLFYYMNIGQDPPAFAGDEPAVPSVGQRGRPRAVLILNHPQKFLEAYRHSGQASGPFRHNALHCVDRVLVHASLEARPVSWPNNRCIFTFSQGPPDCGADP